MTYLSPEDLDGMTVRPSISDQLAEAAESEAIVTVVFDLAEWDHEPVTGEVREDPIVSNIYTVDGATFTPEDVEELIYE